MIFTVRNSLFIGWRYLIFHKIRSITLVGTLAIIVFVPLLLEMIVRESRAQLTARADTTPMILGAPGSSLDLVMGSLYFTRARPTATYLYFSLCQMVRCPVGGTYNHACRYFFAQE